MKKLITFILLIALTSVGLHAQDQYAVRFSADGGSLLQTSRDGSLGLGASMSFLMQDMWIQKSDKNYITITLRAFNNPFDGGKLFSSVSNDKTDAFNYIPLLIGYRMTQTQLEYGWYVEPRLGIAFGYPPYKTLILAPTAGYTFNYLDIGVFADLGFGSPVNAIGSKNFYTVGISLGYNFKF